MSSAPRHVELDAVIAATAASAPGFVRVDDSRISELVKWARFSLAHHSAECNKWRHHRADFNCDCSTADLAVALAAVRKMVEEGR